MTIRSAVVPCLWYNSDAEQAVAFYLSVIGGRELGRLMYPENAPGPAGTLCTIDFEIEGQRLTAVNGGTDPQYNDSLSLQVMVEDQARIDRIWQAILDHGGTESMCGWIQDRWGLRWQIVPASFDRLMASGDTAAIDRAFAAMLKMVKLDGPALDAAARAAA